MSQTTPILALSQGDPAGVGPEIVLRGLAGRQPGWRPVVIAERAALEARRELVPEAPWSELVYREPGDGPASAGITVFDPVAEARTLRLGHSGPADAGAALAALDLGIRLAREGRVDALVTAPISKASIARHHRSDFRGHTDYLAEACGLERYGRDYLMAFLAPELQVALLTVHEPLREALDRITSHRILEALGCLQRHAPGRVAVAGFNPHAGEGGLLGSEDAGILAPAVRGAREKGWPVVGPESADSVFARCRRGEIDWVLALYHDQGLIAVKTLGFGLATNWTLGLPFLRTSVDHGTAFERAAAGRADAGPLRQVIASTLGLLSGELPRRTV